MKSLIEPSLISQTEKFSNYGGKLSDFDYCAGYVIRKLRRERCMTGADVGYAMGYSQQQVSRYERGSSRFTFVILEQFAYVLGVTFWDLLDAIKLFYFIRCDDYFRQNNNCSQTIFHKHTK